MHRISEGLANLERMIHTPEGGAETAVQVVVAAVVAIAIYAVAATVTVAIRDSLARRAE